MKTKIFLALCALAMALCLVGCTAQTVLPGTSWSSDKVPFAEKLGAQGNYVSTIILAKDSIMGLEVAIQGGLMTAYNTIGTWSADANTITFDVSSDWNNPPINYKGTYTVKIDKMTMYWYNDDGSVNTTWTKIGR